MDKGIITEKIQDCLGLAYALNHIAWDIEFVPLEFKEEFNSVLTLTEYLERSIKDVYNKIKSEV